MSGAFWATIDRIISMGAQFLTNLILARILTPSDFGCIGMLAILLLLLKLSSMVDLGVP